MQHVGSRLCQLSIVAHCVPRVYVIPIFGFAGTQCFKQENIDPEMVCWEFLGLGVISLSNRSLYHSRVCAIPTCNATAGVCWVFVKPHLSGVKHGEFRMQLVGSMLWQFSIVVIVSPGSMWSTFLDLQLVFLMFLQDKIDPGSADMLTRVYV